MKKILKYSLIALVLCFGLKHGWNIVTHGSDKSFSLTDYLCTLTPVECNSDLYRRVYLASPEDNYETALNGKRLVVPMGYISTTELLKDPRYPIKETMHLEMLLPDLTPHTPDNIREFFTPYERSKLGVSILIAGPGPLNWEQIQRDDIAAVKRSSNSPVRRQGQFELNGWGEDFDMWPRRRPCANLGDDDPPCDAAHPMDVWYPAKPNRTLSVMVCDPYILPDVDARVMALPPAKREAYFADPKQWAGHRRAMCDHSFRYEPLNASVSLRYPRRFLAQWKETEDGVRNLLDRSIASGETGR